jgi:hypothetical protein
MARIGNADDLMEYFITLASEHNLLLSTDENPHFYEYKDSYKGNNLNYPCVIWLPPTIQTLDNNTDNEHEIYNFEMWILQSTSREDFEGRRAAIALCDQIGFDFSTRLKYDSKNILPPSDRPFLYFNASGLKRDAIGPMSADNAYGVSLSGILGNPRRLNYDDSKWTGEADVKTFIETSNSSLIQ